jgi:uncharacterized peroxidase-related enzyme
MPRIAPVDPDTAAPAMQKTLEGVKRSLGGLPNLVRTFAVSPPLLNGWLGLAGALGGGQISGRLAELVDIAVSEANGCTYCVNAHATIGAAKGATAEQVAAARAGTAADPREAAVIAFALAANRDVGRVTEAELAAARAAGLDDAALLEIAARAVLNRLNNTINHVAGTEVDFPAAPPALARAA